MAKQAVLNGISPEAVEAAEMEIRERQQEVKFDVRDFTLELIVNHFREGLYYVPEYQRFHVWNAEKQARFIESLVLGLPIPMMFLAEMADGTLEIVDGVQRISTLESFFSGDLRLQKLTRLPSLNGFLFDDMPLSQQRKLRTRALRMVVLDELTTFETRQDIFNRVNTSGEKARPAEVRRGAYQGALMTFLEARSQDPVFLRVCPISKPLVLRREPLEFVLRFFAFSEKYKSFSHDVAKFMDKFVLDHKDNFDQVRWLDEFDRTMAFAQKFFPAGFAKKAGSTSTPRVRFEALAVGTNLALREVPDLVPEALDWLESIEFKRHVTTHASNSGPRVKGRVEFVRDRLLGR
jgi:uncharacterized protein with ParB-like and HNH nuclease domain